MLRAEPPVLLSAHSDSILDGTRAADDLRAYSPTLAAPAIIMRYGADAGISRSTPHVR